MVVSIKIDQYGLKSLLRKLDPKRVDRAREQAVGRGSRHLIKVIRAESRVKSGHYKSQWFVRKRQGADSTSHAIVNKAATKRGEYADFVTGNTMATTLSGGRRRGAGAAFMRKIRRENSMRIRRIMQEEVRDIITR